MTDSLLNILDSIFNNVNEMKSGAAQASPKDEGVEDRNGNKCGYCNYRSICRKKTFGKNEDEE